MDLIEIRGIRVQGRHGANPGERERPQPFDVDVRIEADLRAAASSDNLTDTIDYAALYAMVAQLVGSRSYTLLERLAGEILSAILTDPRVARASVSIAKPALLDGATPRVTIERERGASRT